jgi:hypothetical protein
LTLLCASALATLALSCSNSHGGGVDPTPVNALVGDWIVDASTITIIEDTGAPHDVLDGDHIRIAPDGLSVLLNTYVQEGGAYDRFLEVLGGSYTVVRNQFSAGTLAAGDLDVCLLVDCSGAHSELPKTLMLEIKCTATVLDTELEAPRLKFSYMSRSIYKGTERERDELEFLCDLIAGPPPDMTGTWETTGIKVFSDTGGPHPFKTGDLTEVQLEKITKLMGIDFNALAILGAGAANYDVLGDYSYAGQGRAEAMFVAIGKKATAAEGYRELLALDAIRSGSALIADSLMIYDDGKTENIDHLLVSMILKSSKKAVLEPGLADAVFGAGAKKLVMALITPLHGH